MARASRAVEDNRHVLTLADENDPVYHDARAERGLRGGSAKCVWRDSGGGGRPEACGRCFREERRGHEADTSADITADASCAACFSQRHVYGHYLDLVREAPRPTCRP